jgi:hypothetical protein
VTRARSRTWSEQHGGKGGAEQAGQDVKELKNVVGRWRTDGGVE